MMMLLWDTVMHLCYVQSARNCQEEEGDVAEAAAVVTHLAKQVEQTLVLLP